MSELTARRTAPSTLGAAAVMFATSALVTYGVALAVDEGYYLWCGIAGLAAFLTGRRARRAMERGLAEKVILLATIVGALAGSVVIVCSLAFAASHVV